jgi:hypothetical protein
LLVERRESRIVPGFIDGLSYNVGFHPSAVAVGDFTGDGIPDLAVANLDSGTVSVLLGNGNGTFQPSVEYASGISSISLAVAGFNGDGVLDLAVVQNNPLGVHPTLSLLLGNGDGTFQPAVWYSAGEDPVAVAAGDLNGDGFPDLAVANYRVGTATVVLNDGNWPSSGGSAPGRETGSGGNRHPVASLSLPDPVLSLSANGLPSSATANSAARQEPLLAPGVEDARLPAAPPDEAAAPVAAPPAVHQDALGTQHWHARINDPDVLAAALATLAWGPV